MLNGGLRDRETCAKHMAIWAMRTLPVNIGSNIESKIVHTGYSSAQCLGRLSASSMSNSNGPISRKPPGLLSLQTRYMSVSSSERSAPAYNVLHACGKMLPQKIPWRYCICCQFVRRPWDLLSSSPNGPCRTLPSCG